MDAHVRIGAERHFHQHGVTCGKHERVGTIAAHGHAVHRVRQLGDEGLASESHVDGVLVELNPMVLQQWRSRPTGRDGSGLSEAMEVRRRQRIEEDPQLGQLGEQPLELVKLVFDDLPVDAKHACRGQVLQVEVPDVQEAALEAQAVTAHILIGEAVGPVGEPDGRGCWRPCARLEVGNELLAAGASTLAPAQCGGFLLRFDECHHGLATARIR